ncbi:MAG: MmgE/PrpD family protein [Pseudomonadota bacterium]
MQAAIDGVDGDGGCTVIGHNRTCDSAGAALINGTAAHGEDFDDTFEGGPVHAGVVIAPAIFSAAERFTLDGAAALLGLAVGAEVTCRLSTVAPRMVHKAGFHPTWLFGAIGAAAGVGAALKLPPRHLVDAMGIAGSMASGIIEYLADGSWTKRLHPGWAAQAGIRAALLARQGFEGPRSVFEGEHGLFNGFAHTTQGKYERLTGGFGKDWVAETIAFKPYACGTMTHPYIDCAGPGWPSAASRPTTSSRCCARSARARCIGCGSRWPRSRLCPTPMRENSARRSASPAGFVPGDCGLAAFTEGHGARSARTRARRQGALTSSTRTTPIPTTSPATSAPPCATAASSRSARRTSAAAPTSRCRAPRSKPSSPPTPPSAAGPPAGSTRP